MSVYNQNQAEALELLHETLCLDFTNTVGIHPPEDHNDFFSRYDQIIDWGHHVGLLDASRAHQLLDQAALSPTEAEAARQQTIAVREITYRVLSAIAAEETPNEDDLGAFNDALNIATRYMQLMPAASQLEWVFISDASDLNQLWYPAVWSAAQMMTSHELTHLRECAADDCDWLFMDTSRNHSRRWCSMSNCGNRAKARGHYQRKRGKE